MSFKEHPTQMKDENQERAISISLAKLSKEKVEQLKSKIKEVLLNEDPQVLYPQKGSDIQAGHDSSHHGGGHDSNETN